MPSLLEGKVALVTGAAHGVGRGHAIELSRHGAKVVVNDLGGTHQGIGKGFDADEVVDLIQELGGEAVADYGDVAEERDAEAMVQAAYARWGRLDVVVNNAGILRDNPIWEMPVDDFDAVLRVHVRGTWLVSRAAVRQWRDLFTRTQAAVNGRIVNTTSGVGMAGNVAETNYSSAKAAIIGLTYALHAEVGAFGITCNAIGPSGNTRMAAAAGTNTGDSTPIEPTGRETSWHPHDPANSSPLVAWLASDEAAHVSGQIFRVPGDRIAWMSHWFERRSIGNHGERWDATTLGKRVATEIFGSWHAGWPASLENPVR